MLWFIMVMNIILADDHSLFRDSMALWLKQLADDVRVIQASTYDEVVAFIGSEPSLDIVLLDLYMPGMRGAVSVEQLVRLDGDAPIVMMSADENPNMIKQCIHAGASGYLLKSSDGQVVLGAIRTILAGGSFVPISMLDDDVAVPTLNNKQHQVLLLMAEGLSNKEIAEQTNLSAGTVKQYVSIILKVLEVHNRTQAIIIAKEIGLLKPV
ncbi:MAG: response regulator transcription factor [Ghiorsea sp.]|nr:response regulator transcription factor [Ghiorsea sp.]